MENTNWVNEFPAAVTVADAAGIIIAMNERSISTFAADGGRALIGKNLSECHPGTSAEKLQTLLENRRMNCYTIEKNGAWKMIYQCPWFENGEYRGFVELSLPIPEQMPHFIRS